MKQRINFYLKKLKGKELVMLVILGVGLAILVIQVGRKQLLQKRAAGGNATIVLTPSTNSPITIANGGNFNLVVSLNSNGESLVGADVLLTFNQAILIVNSITIPTTFAVGQNLQTYAPVNANGSFNPVAVITSANSSGTLEMGAVAFNWSTSATTPAQTVAVSPFATINFRAIAPGTTNVRIKFTSGSTTDSNLVSIASGTPTDVISDSTATALSSTVPVTISDITPTVLPTIVSTVVPTIVPTVVPGNGSLNFKVKFQGITTAKPDKLVRVILRQGSTDAYTFNNVAVTADAAGVYSGSVANINPGNYDVLIKGPVHLQKKMSGIAITTSGTANWPTAAPTLLTGDINNDNKVDSTDYALLLLKYSPGVVQSGTPDLNFDDRIDSSDYSLLILNFNPLGGGD